jgi:hypothetical protein
MMVDKVWKLTNTFRVGLDDRSSHSQRQSTFPDNVYSYCPPCHGVSHCENLTTFFSKKKFTLEVLLNLPHHKLTVKLTTPKVTTYLDLP